MDLSVIVSTYNRAEDLRRLLESLAASRLAQPVLWEVVVADNGSTDATADVVAQCAARAPFPLTRVFEPRRGKSHGLNSALAVARGAHIAFTDDDIIVAPDWVDTIARHFRAHPESRCIGGRVELHDERDAPVTIKRSREAARYDLARFSPDNIPILGCNMALSAQTLREVGAFDPDIGPGSRIGVAEDLDMLYRVVRGGAVIEYLPGMLVHHNHGRRTREQLRALSAGYYTGRGAFYAKHILRGDRTTVRWAYWEVRALMRARRPAATGGPRGLERIRVLGLLARGVVRYLRFARRATG